MGSKISRLAIDKRNSSVGAGGADSPNSGASRKSLRRNSRSYSDGSGGGGGKGRQSLGAPAPPIIPSENPYTKPRGKSLPPQRSSFGSNDGGTSVFIPIPESPTEPNPIPPPPVLQPQRTSFQAEVHPQDPKIWTNNETRRHSLGQDSAGTGTQLEVVPEEELSNPDSGTAQVDPSTTQQSSSTPGSTITTTTTLRIRTPVRGGGLYSSSNSNSIKLRKPGSSASEPGIGRNDNTGQHRFSRSNPRQQQPKQQQDPLFHPAPYSSPGGGNYLDCGCGPSPSEEGNDRGPGRTLVPSKYRRDPYNPRLRTWAPPVYIDLGGGGGGGSGCNGNGLRGGRGRETPVDRLKNVDIIEELSYFAPDCCGESGGGQGHGMNCSSPPPGDYGYYSVCNECGEPELVCDGCPCCPCPCPQEKVKNPVTYTRRQRFNFKNKGTGRDEDEEDGPPFKWPYRNSACRCNCCSGARGRDVNCSCPCCRSGRARRANSFDEIPVGKNPEPRPKHSTDQINPDPCNDLVPSESGVYFFDAQKKKFIRHEIDEPPQEEQQQIVYEETIEPAQEQPPLEQQQFVLETQPDPVICEEELVPDLSPVLQPMMQQLLMMQNIMGMGMMPGCCMPGCMPPPGGMMGMNPMMDQMTMQQQQMQQQQQQQQQMQFQGNNDGMCPGGGGMGMMGMPGMGCCPPGCTVPIMMMPNGNGGCGAPCAGKPKRDKKSKKKKKKKRKKDSSSSCEEDEEDEPKVKGKGHGHHHHKKHHKHRQHRSTSKGPYFDDDPLEEEEYGSRGVSSVGASTNRSRRRSGGDSSSESSNIVVVRREEDEDSEDEDAIETDVTIKFEDGDTSQTEIEVETTVETTMESGSESRPRGGKTASKLPVSIKKKVKGTTPNREPKKAGGPPSRPPNKGKVEAGAPASAHQKSQQQPPQSQGQNKGKRLSTGLGQKTMTKKNKDQPPQNEVSGPGIDPSLVKDSLTMIPTGPVVESTDDEMVEAEPISQPWAPAEPSEVTTTTEPLQQRSKSSLGTALAGASKWKSVTLGSKDKKSTSSQDQSQVPPAQPSNIPGTNTAGAGPTTGQTPNESSDSDESEPGVTIETQTSDYNYNNQEPLYSKRFTQGHAFTQQEQANAEKRLSLDPTSQSIPPKIVVTVPSPPTLTQGGPPPPPLTQSPPPLPLSPPPPPEISSPEPPPPPVPATFQRPSHPTTNTIQDPNPSSGISKWKFGKKTNPDPPATTEPQQSTKGLSKWKFGKGK